jgi:hypothetical protein
MLVDTSSSIGLGFGLKYLIEVRVWVLLVREVVVVMKSQEPLREAKEFSSI